MICTCCNKYNGSYELNNMKYCSNCYYYLKEGEWRIIPEILIKKLGYDKYIQRNKINHIFKLVSVNFDKMNLNDLNEMLRTCNITSHQCDALYNIFQKEDNKYNDEIQHILCSKVINYWDLKTNIGSCYYGNYGEVPANLEELDKKINKNKDIFDYFYLKYK